MTRPHLLFTAVAALFLASSVPAEAPRASAFIISIEHTPSGVRMTCVDGCIWKTLNVEGCEPEKPCFLFDQNGMREP
jgi:hypothetical protein